MSIATVVAGAVAAYSAYKMLEMTIQMYILALLNNDPNTYYNFTDRALYVEKIRNSNTYKNFINQLDLKLMLAQLLHEQRSSYLFGTRFVDYDEKNSI